MTPRDFDSLTTEENTDNSPTIIHANGSVAELPDSTYVRDADMSRDGMDLVLEGPHGTVVIDGYFAADPAPNLVAPDGATLTPQLVHSFAHGNDFAQAGTLDDESAVGSVQEVTGHATVTHTDGSVETITLGTKIYQGDVVETDAEGAVNIVFIDETSFAVSESARLSIDEYVYDPATESGVQNFSVLKGIFVFTSGLIGRDDPDDVNIETPAGSIGIRGTIIAGNVNTGEITVVEGAIVLKDLAGHEVTLADQFETAQFVLGGEIQHVGQLSAEDVSSRFFFVSQVSPTLFSSISDAAQENGNQSQGESGEQQGQEQPGEQGAEPPEPPAPPSTPSGDGGFNSGGNSGFAPNGGNLPPPGGNNPPPPQGALPPLPPGGNLPPPPNNPPPLPNGSGEHFVPPPNDGAVNHAPVHDYANGADAAASHEYMSAGEGQSWSYDFSDEFKDASGDTLTYALHADTIAALNSWVYDGAGASLDILASWGFDAATGVLTLNFHTTFDSANFDGDDIETLLLRIAAFDQDGASSGWHNYHFDAHNTNTNSFTDSADNQWAVISTAGTFNPGSGNHLFLSDGDDAVTFLNATASNNYVNMGDGENVATIQNGAVGNTVVGGSGGDNFGLWTGDAHVYGMDGNDCFILKLNTNPALSTVAGDLMGNVTDAVIDGGSGHDTLKLEGNYDGANVLDFGAIHAAGNIIQGIEVLDLSTGDQSVSLDYDSIVAMTDSDHRLFINMNSSSDSVTFTGAEFANMNQTGDDVTIDGHVYDVYTDGNVTLYIEQSGGENVGTVTGL